MLLFLSCWDNSVYIYDMNFNRCIQTLEDLHEDAISRVRVLAKTSARTYLLTASWDSLIKLWCMNNRTFKVKCLNEICHDSACLDLATSRSHLAIVCKDGNLYLWKTNAQLLTEATGDDSSSANNNAEEYSDDEEDDFYEKQAARTGSDTNYFTFLFKIQNSNDIGRINDAKILELTENSCVEAPGGTLAVCTSLGYVKIVNIENNTELFSLRVSSAAIEDRCHLNKILYTLDYIVAVDSNGFVYFIDLKQDQLIGASNTTTTQHSFLAHSLRVAACSLTSLSAFDDRIFSVSDTDGNLYLLSSDSI